jgi:hypothetical protein
MPTILSQMLANHFVLKLVLAPLIIFTATLVSRRWGEIIGGLMVGLPLTSAPVSIFFAIEQGKPFAANAAHAAMLGLVPVAAFGIGYVLASRRFGLALTATSSIVFYLVTVWAVSFITPGLWIIVPLALAALGLAQLIIGRPRTQPRSFPSPWWDLPLRMFIATAILIAITTAASFLGPKWSGLLSPFPIFTFVMASFTFHLGGSDSAWRFVRGLLTGLLGYLVFFLVVSLLVKQASLVVAYSLATLAALGLNSVSLIRQVSKGRTI